MTGNYGHPSGSNSARLMRWACRWLTCWCIRKGHPGDVGRGGWLVPRRKADHCDPRSDPHAPYSGSQDASGRHLIALEDAQILEAGTTAAVSDILCAQIGLCQGRPNTRRSAWREAATNLYDEHRNHRDSETSRLMPAGVPWPCPA